MIRGKPQTYKVDKHSMNQLRDAYLMVKNHSYRNNRVGSQKQFLNAMHNMGKKLSTCLYLHFYGRNKDTGIAWNTEEIDWDNKNTVPKSFSELFHDYNHLIGEAQYTDDVPQSVMEMFEHYISQVHKFLDNEEWLKYRYYGMSVKHWIYREYHEEVHTFELSDGYIKEHGIKTITTWKKWANNSAYDEVKEAVKKDIERMEIRFKGLGIELSGVGGSE